MAGLCEGGNEPPGSLKAVPAICYRSPCSPDMTPLDFCQWDFVKDQTHSTHVENLGNLRQKDLSSHRQHYTANVAE
ncbi:hypothetical protein ANN_17751 [Periplaneta americana]|uniref:Uncharacterized protein n=1 Tax=Periplaneta americana TaxID=6978 RepID=A0ABQ8STT9_PERAM|nr:hypothetical protein ANN_17751 [Periplaneta americana]